MDNHKAVGAAIGIAGYAAAPMAKRETAFSNVEELCVFAHKLAVRVEALEDRLVGGKPRAGSNSCDEIADGVLPILSQQAVGARGRLGDAMAAIDAIERALP